MDVGNNIRTLREVQNFTQEYMAQELEISLSAYSKIERGETNITLKRLEQIAYVLKVGLNELLDFNKQNIFNLSNNRYANGLVQNQQILGYEGWERLVSKLEKENEELKQKLNKN